MLCFCWFQSLGVEFLGGHFAGLLSLAACLAFAITVGYQCLIVAFRI